MTTDRQPEQVHAEESRFGRNRSDSDRDSGIRTDVRPHGPAAGTMIAAVAFLLLAAGAAIVQAREVTVDWSRVGPAALIATGIVLVLAGALGLLRRR